MTPAEVLRHMSTVQDDIAMRCGYAPTTARKYQELAAAGRYGAACIEACEHVLQTFERDEARGYRSRDRQFAIDLLKKASEFAR